MKLPIFVLLLVSACGASSTPAPAPAPAPTPAPEPAPPPPAATADTSPTPAPPDAGAAPTPVTEAPDQCTPVGVDFEKRARPKLKECYAQGKKKDPNLEGTVKIKITVDVKGKIKSVKVIENSLTQPVADCMLNVVKKTPFPEVDKCWDATLTIPITFPTPR
jgi:TonB family protein